MPLKLSLQVIVSKGGPATGTEGFQNTFSDEQEPEQRNLRGRIRTPASVQLPTSLRKHRYV